MVSTGGSASDLHAHSAEVADDTLACAVGSMFVGYLLCISVLILASIARAAACDKVVPRSYSKTKFTPTAGCCILPGGSVRMFATRKHNRGICRPGYINGSRPKVCNSKYFDQEPTEHSFAGWLHRILYMPIYVLAYVYAFTVLPCIVASKYIRNHYGKSAKTGVLILGKMGKTAVRLQILCTLTDWYVGSERGYYYRAYDAMHFVIVVKCTVLGVQGLNRLSESILNMLISTMSTIVATVWLQTLLAPFGRARPRRRCNGHRNLGAT